jgi:uncharacterized membrane protein
MTAAPARDAHRFLLGAWALLMAIVCAWIATLASAAGAVAGASLVLVPLALPVRGMLARSRGTLRWAPFTLSPALIWSLTELIADPPARPLATATLAAALAAFAALLACLRAGGQS